MSTRHYVYGFLPVLLLLGNIECTRAAKKVNPHISEKACSTCHVEKDKVTHEITPELIKDPIALCTKCHPKGIQDHKMDFVPARSMPAGFPTSREGKLVCHTCHDPHRKTKERAALRMEANALCMACHPDK